MQPLPFFMGFILNTSIAEQGNIVYNFRPFEILVG